MFYQLPVEYHKVSLSPYAAAAEAARAFTTSFWIKPRMKNPTAAMRMTVTQFVAFQVKITDSFATRLPLSICGVAAKNLNQWFHFRLMDRSREDRWIFRGVRRKIVSREIVSRRNCRVERGRG